MDGVELLYKLKNTGAEPENRKEKEFIDELKSNGLVYFDKQTNLFKLHKEAIIEDGIDEVSVSMSPKLISLVLFVQNDNFVQSLEIKPKDLAIQLNYLGNIEVIDWSKLLKDKKLGNEFFA